MGADRNHRSEPGPGLGSGHDSGHDSGLGSGHDSGRDSGHDSGLGRIEGYLLGNAEPAQARREAAGFTDHLPWLTTAQREEVERVYVADRVRLSRETLRRVIARAAELRGEYTEHYRRLRRRCVAAAVVGAGAAAGALGAAAYLTR